MKRLSMGMVLVTLFWFGNHTTLVWAAAGVQTAIPIAGTLGALVATSNAAVARDRVAWASTALAVLPAGITTYSSGTGPPVWAALIAVSLLDGSRWRSAGLFAS